VIKPRAGLMHRFFNPQSKLQLITLGSMEMSLKIKESLANSMKTEGAL